MHAVRPVVLAAVALALSACEAKVATFEIAPTKLTFSNTAEAKNLTVTLKDKSGAPIEEARTVTWTSADPKVARVDEKGTVKSGGSGTTTITAKVDELTATASVDVVVLKQIQVQAIALVLVAGGKSEALGVNFMNERGEPLAPDFEKRPAWKPVWKSADAAVATVDDSGVITGVAAGTTVVSAHVGDLKTELTLTVNPAPDTPAPEAPPPGKAPATAPGK